MEPLVWSILLLVAGLAIIALEVFVPSAGVLSCLAALTILASIVVAFLGGVGQGLIMLVVTSLILPVVIAAAIRWWPHTPIGRLVLIERPESPDDVLPETESYRGLRSLIGHFGVAKTKMLTSGTVRIDGRTYDAISEGMPVEAGQRIKVVDVRTNRIVVRPVIDEELRSEETARSSEDLLSRPIDSLGIDDPLA